MEKQSTACELNVGDVFSVADARDVAPLYLMADPGVKFTVDLVTMHSLDSVSIGFRTVTGWADIKTFALNHPVTVHVPDGDPVPIAPTPPSALQLELVTVKDQLTEKDRVIGEQTQRIRDGEYREASLRDMRNALERDLETVNTVLNEQADYRSWCETYEDIVSDVNAKMTSGFTFKGRDRSYDVNVVVTTTFVKTITVDAASREAAMELVRDMGTREVYEKIELENVYDESSSDEIEVSGASLSD